ncbi:MAG: peptidoglycan editing factor PgeF [Syntrophaceae bacterium]|nr:peptidoglycan editing factor PgeF [Syntrophaceae bacterium]
MILSQIISKQQFVAGFSTRADDISGSPPFERFRGRVYRARQIHSNRAFVINDEEPEAVGQIEADALVTGKRNLLMTVWVADCVPILLAHEHGLCVAAVHAGWRGLAGGIIRAALETMKSIYGAPSAAITASVGPAIGPCCYEVGHDVSERIAVSCGDSSVVSVRKGRIFADLHSAAKLQLLAAGVKASSIEVANFCTHCRDDIFYSRRRGNLTERQCGFIGMIESNSKSAC